ncbi:TrbI/VirB10 family protein [Massilia niabensis]|uniref:TrbI/VirB10 family protein n=1 Tax=Massilia niabensis TaxID=544910 RepID=A0ABW0L4I7_9BURK
MSSDPERDMSPEASPGQLSRGAGVRRVNNVPLYLLGGAMATFLVIMASVAASRSHQPSQSGAKAPQKAGTATMFANAIVGDQKDGIIHAAATPPAIPGTPELTAEIPDMPAMSRLDNPELPPAPPTSSQQQRAEQQQMGQGGMRSPDDEAPRIRTMKLQQLDEAVRARSGLQIAAPRIASSSASNAPAGTAPANHDEVLAKLTAVRQQIEAANADDPGEAYKARLQLLRASQAVGKPGGSDAPQLVQPGTARNDVARFSEGEGKRWRLDAQPEAPRTPYELRAGFVVPGILISGINSELPGQIMAQVSQDVYDTPRGKWKLIPKGSRLVGAYSSDVAYGQARVLVAWQRIVFPDGKAMDIGAMPGADSAGYVGFNDRVNNHYWRTFSSAVLMSAVTAGIATSQPENSGYGRPSFGSAMSEAVGQQLGQVTAQLIAKNLNIAPTLEIRPGYRFNVVVTKDISFSKPYQPFDY